MPQSICLRLTGQPFSPVIPLLLIHIYLFVFNLHVNEFTSNVFSSLSNYKYRCLVSKHTMVLKLETFVAAAIHSIQYMWLYKFEILESVFVLPYSFLCRKVTSVFLKILVYLFALGFHINIITSYTCALIIIDAIRCLKLMKGFKKWANNCAFCPWFYYVQNGVTTEAGIRGSNKFNCLFF